MRSFTVQEGLMGYIVQVGCQVCAFSTKEELAAKVSEYIMNPEETEKKYYAPKPPQAYAGEEIRPVAAVEKATGLRRG